LSTNPILEEINDVYTGLLALSKLFAQSNPKDTQQMCHEERKKRWICTQNGYDTGTKGRTKSYHCMSCSPKQIFQETWPSPSDRFAQEAIALPRSLNPGREALLTDAAHYSIFQICSLRILTYPEKRQHT